MTDVLHYPTLKYHDMSMVLGKAFAVAYNLGFGDLADDLLEKYKEMRRRIRRGSNSWGLPHKRYGSYDAYLATQGHYNG